MCNPPLSSTNSASSTPTKTDDKLAKESTTPTDKVVNNDGPSPFWMPRRAMIAFVANLFPCIYLDAVASNYALARWTLLNDEQKVALPDMIHDNFAYWDNHILKEAPMAFLYAIVALGFMLPYDVLGKSPSRHYPSYRRGECSVRFLETRCLLELMRACTVFCTTISDPHGHYCTQIETHEMKNIWTTWTFARCGDNIFSGHASHLVSLGLCVQAYYLPMKSGGVHYKCLSACLWACVVCLSFFIVVSRMHYTVDVVLACFLVPSVWFAWIGIVLQADQNNQLRTQKSKMQ